MTTQGALIFSVFLWYPALMYLARWFDKTWPDLSRHLDKQWPVAVTWPAPNCESCGAPSNMGACRYCGHG